MMKFKKYFNLKIIAIFAICAFILNSAVYGIDQPVRSQLRVPMMGSSSDRKGILEVGLISSANPVDIRHRFEDRARVLGGKAAWDEILEGLAPLIGFHVASPSVRLSIKDVWGEFIKANLKSITYGNSLIEADLKQGSVSVISEETVLTLRKIIRTELVFPEELEKTILAVLDGGGIGQGYCEIKRQA